MPWINSPMPNCKTDTNNRTGFSTDFIGGADRWPEASYAEREAIVFLTGEAGTEKSTVLREFVRRQGESAFLRDQFGGESAFQTDLWRAAKFRMIFLRTLHRHGGDPAFWNVLRNIRRLYEDGKINKCDLPIIKPLAQSAVAA